jgi:hypothetical protein
MKSKFNIIYEQVMNGLLTEGGNAVSNVGPIKRENIKPTIDYLTEIIFKPLNIDNSLWTSELGSVGKKDVSGDIDIAINMTELMKQFNMDSLEEVKQILIEKLLEHDFEVARHGNNIHFRFPIQGSQQGEYVQIDFFPSSNLKYTKLVQYSPDQKDSRYKGLHRTDLFRVLVKSVSMAVADDATDEDKIEYIGQDGRKYPAVRYTHISVLDDGFFKVTKTFRGKRNNFTKHESKVKDKTVFITDDFQEILDLLFGKNTYTIKDLNSFETIWNNILMEPNFKYKNKLDDIIVTFYHILKDKNPPAVIPEEMLKYLTEHNLLDENE